MKKIKSKKNNMIGKMVYGSMAITFSMLPQLAQAVVSVDANTGSMPFASEITQSTTSAATLSATNTADFTVQGTLGASFSNGVGAFVRFDLDNSATFSGAPAFNVQYNSSNSTVVATSTLSSGGNGQSYVIFAVSPSGSSSLDLNNQLTFDPSTGINVFNGSTTKVQYRLFENLTNAANSLYPIKSATADYITRKALNSTAKTSVTPSQINVVTGSKEFIPASTPVGTTTTNLIGQINIGEDGTVYIANGSLGNATAAKMDTAGAGSVFTVSGDFTAAQSLTGTTPNGSYNTANVWMQLTTAGVCASGSALVSSSTLNATTATFVLDDKKTGVTSSSSGTGAAVNVCMQVNGQSAINSATYTGAYTIVDASGYTVDNWDAGTLATITKNSKSLQTPWFTKPSGTQSRFILTNMGTADVQFTTTLYSDATTTATIKAPYTGLVTVPAGKQVSVEVVDLVDFVGTSSKAAVVFDFLGSSTTIQGSYQYYNRATGLWVNTPLTRPHVD